MHFEAVVHPRQNSTLRVQKKHSVNSVCHSVHSDVLLFFWGDVCFRHVEPVEQISEIQFM